MNKPNLCMQPHSTRTVMWSLATLILALLMLMLASTCGAQTTMLVRCEGCVSICASQVVTVVTNPITFYQYRVTQYYLTNPMQVEDTWQDAPQGFSYGLLDSEQNRKRVNPDKRGYEVRQITRLEFDHAQWHFTEELSNVVLRTVVQVRKVEQQERWEDVP